MNLDLLEKLIDSFAHYIENADDNYGFDERERRRNHYQSFDYNKIINMSYEDVLSYIKELWAVIPVSANKIIDKNGLDKFKKLSSNLVIW